MSHIINFLNNSWVSGIGATFLFSALVFVFKNVWEYVRRNKALKSANSTIINTILGALVGLETSNADYIQSVMDSVYRDQNIPENRRNSPSDIINDLITATTKLQYISNTDKDSIIKKLLVMHADEKKKTTVFIVPKNSIEQSSTDSHMKSNLYQFLYIYVFTLTFTLLLVFLIILFNRANSNNLNFLYWPFSRNLSELISSLFSMIAVICTVLFAWKTSRRNHKK